MDNTAFPLFNDEFFAPDTDVYVNVNFETIYIITEEYNLYMIVGGGIAFAILCLLIMTICLYKKHKKIYSSVANQRRKASEHLATDESVEADLAVN